MDKKLEEMINDLFDDGEKLDAKSEFKIYKSGKEMAILIKNMGIDQIEELSINAIGRILDLFPMEHRKSMIKLAFMVCKTEDGLLFGGDD